LFSKIKFLLLLLLLLHGRTPDDGLEVCHQLK